MHHYSGTLWELEQEFMSKLQRDNDGVWFGRAQALLHQALPAIFESSVLTNTPLTNESLVNRLSYRALLRLSSSRSISEPSQQCLRTYFANLPGHSLGLHQQAENIHGYVLMLLSTVRQTEPLAV